MELDPFVFVTPLDLVQQGATPMRTIIHESLITWQYRKLMTPTHSQVTCLAWNPKNTDVLASASNDGYAKLWDLVPADETNSFQGPALGLLRKPTGMQHKGVEANLKNITAIDWHPDGTVLATGA